MTIRFEQVGKTFVAKVHGVDLSQTLDPKLSEIIEDGLSRYGVLIFKNQAIGDDEQQAFIEKFGPPVVTTLKELATGHPHFYDIATVNDDGTPIPEDSVRGLYLLANQLWHTDGSQNQPPIRLTALHARVLPPNPPPTEYADMCAAYDALTDNQKAEFDDLMVEHSIYWSRQKMGLGKEAFSEDTLATRKPVVHPLIRTHHISGRKSLYLASHASHIIGWPLEQGRALIDKLVAHATQERFVYTVHWELNDLVMWDDAWTMHRATPYTDNYPRKMRWCAVRELQAV
jgi:alpha-ketoglutarate-dependent 2,4-dichlorophenoxyacetate dioxygenase